MIIKQLSYKQVLDDDKIWLSEIDNHWNEIVGFRHKLLKLAKLVKTMDVSVDRQHFELQFKILELTMKNLTKKIKLHHRKLGRFPTNQSLLGKGQHYDEHESLRKEIGAFRIMYLENQKEFYGFTAKCKLKMIVTNSSFH